MKNKSLYIFTLLMLLSSSAFAGRYYDSAIGRWLSVDPKVHKYSGWSPYNYCLNNPIRLIDPNGDSVAVNGMQTSLQNDVISSLNQISGIPLYITETGMLAPTPTANVFGQSVQLASAYGSTSGTVSEEAASFLNFAMSSSTVVNTIGTSVLGSQGGGQLIRMNQKQISSFISATPPELNSQTMGFGLVFLHELTHTDLGQAYHNSSTPLIDPISGAGTGFVVDYMNKIRAELGSNYGQRMNYTAYPYQNNMFYIPFSSPTGNTKIIFGK